ncbi:MAG: AzlD domain-containing protein [Synergistaceae bacterium]|nr:AzlD domain-containing protein [Synergistaceae bacterium]
MTRIMILSLFMMAVTAPSRILPVFFLEDRKLPQFIEALLHYIPYAVLGALIFPDVLTATGNIYTSAAGAVSALILGWYGRGILVVLTGGILAAYIAGQFIGI